jgi:hypothetical protein
MNLIRDVRADVQRTVQAIGTDHQASSLIKITLDVIPNAVSIEEPYTAL